MHHFQLFIYTQYADYSGIKLQNVYRNTCQLLNSFINSLLECMKEHSYAHTTKVQMNHSTHKSMCSVAFSGSEKNVILVDFTIRNKTTDAIYKEKLKKLQYVFISKRLFCLEMMLLCCPTVPRHMISSSPSFGGNFYSLNHLQPKIYSV